MGLYLCSTDEVKNPYPVRDLGLSLHSKEELAYYIYNYVFLIESDFLNEQLLTFIGTELNMPKLEAKIRKWGSDSPDLSYILFMILTDLHFYTEKELQSFREELDWMKKAALSERRKKRADYMLSQKKYAAAIAGYDNILGSDRDSATDDGFLSAVFHNKAMANAGLFEYEKAMTGLLRAYDYSPADQLLKEMYFLCLLSERKDVPDVLVRGANSESLYQWKSEYDNLYKGLENNKQVQEIRALGEKDSVRRKAGTDKIINTWKQQYREMARV